MKKIKICFPRILGLICMISSIFSRSNNMSISTILSIVIFLIGIVLFMYGEKLYKGGNKNYSEHTDINNIIFNRLIFKVIGWLIVIFLAIAFIEKPRIWKVWGRSPQISNGAINLLDIIDENKYCKLNKKVGFAYNEKVITYVKDINRYGSSLSFTLIVENGTDEILKNDPDKFFVEDNMKNKYFLNLFKNIKFEEPIEPGKVNEAKILIEGIDERIVGFTVNAYLDGKSNLCDEEDKYIRIRISSDDFR
ncbi:hypothetical protein [Clostridium frigidicarnis]|uniref:Uncharacterized protein n=1 Tax=Clostridium frigidicarnis TaxID=84698 RepID=A0A1I0YH91_9CLOT|nr:hypothetical protein [Clostridium frigidicarnis]SFB12237.1 hypothetical protein SAMN04488528_101314 [Clostridium frigidicarnis]